MFEEIENLVERARLIKKYKDKEWKRQNKEKVKEAAKKYRKEHPEKIKKANNTYKEKNPEYKKEYYKLHKERVKEWYNNRSIKQKESKAEYNKRWKKNRYKNNIGYRLRCIISTAIRKSLKGNKQTCIKKLLGYTIEDLKIHLENQFEDWMTWENIGLTAKEPRKTWQIDHIRPVNMFNIQEEGDGEFKKCWALDNLRPLDSYINVSRPKDGSDI